MTTSRFDVDVPPPFALIAAAIAGVFIYHLIEGWQTGVVRFPLSVLVVEEFERERSPSNFWGIMVLDLVGAVFATLVCISGLWRLLNA